VRPRIEALAERLLDEIEANGPTDGERTVFTSTWSVTNRADDRDARSVTERERRTLGVRHADRPSARGENQSSAGSIAMFNSACRYSCRVEHRPSDPNQIVTQPDAVRCSRVAGS
jgi:hypothetical protein